ncbi:transcriptional regulator family: Fungal Specific TF [Trichoderma aggressivum f. europaeum]|uniref:Transcriptional regulator family: Fungal Specific TF n=1 Tax=Trichoderma aggressivum f. europaeum TaxID=173218 RepID=A0AAE1IFW5_9HYPO|nr:transcriptional regulator family: Fungal Specific TF [Trichoderma aggressivum f. europaeum]
MAEDRHRQEYPQQHRPEDIKHQPPPSFYHHLPSRDAPHSDTDRSPHSRTTMATSVTLPSIHDPRPSGYGPPPPAGRGYVSDPRYESPNAVNGYPPPPGSQQQPASYLPPLQPQADMRSAYPPPEPPRGAYYDDRRPPPHPAYHDQYASEYYYRGLPQGHHNGYPHDYSRPPPAYAQDYGQPGMERPREAPRQRTSIACRYCRKRKIRCSGHQNAPGGKCQNCARMNQECIFQPVSSSSSTAFIPVSAVPGGVPPGTQLFGAYGQPLAPSAVPHPHPHPHPPHHPPHPSHPYPPTAGPPHPPPGAYYHPQAQSPTDSYSSYGELRGDDQLSGRRRRRSSPDPEDAYRLPPPRAGVAEDDHRRRSPAELSNNSSPGSLSYSRYAGPARHSPRNPALPHPASVGNADGRSPVTQQNGSSGSSTPARSGPSNSQSQQSSSIMSLSNLVDKNDIDKTMIDRLNRPRDTGSGQSQRESSR